MAIERGEYTDFSADEAARLLQDLKTHQIELEMQNEELQKVQLELEDSRNRYFQLYNLAPVGYCTLSNKGIILEANLTLGTMLNVPRSKMIQAPFSLFVLNEDRDTYYRQKNILSKPGLFYQQYDLRMLRKDGNPFWAKLEMTKGAEAESPPIYRVVVSDINERKTVEEALKKSHDELEQRVKERTAELKATVDRLARANQELQEFTFIASHDLQEPLRKIESFGELVKDKGTSVLDPDSQDHLDRLLRSTQRMRRLLSDLLVFSRVTTKVEPFKEIDPGKMAREAVEVLELRVRETGAEIIIGPIPFIEADESQILQLFQNLIANAMKFRKSQAPQIQISGRIIEQGICEILVMDNGIGFDMQFVKEIFKPFERLHGRSTYEGTGMGLAICRKIVERHGGTIRAESEPGKGTTFIIRLPLKQVIPERI